MSHARRVPLLLAAIAGVYAVSMSMVGTAAFAVQPTVIAAGIAFDLTITASLLVWWFGVRHGLPWWTVGATFGIGSLTARLFLPDSPVVMVLAGAWVLAEVAIVVLLVSRVRRLVRAARRSRGPGPVAALEDGLRAVGVPGKLVSLIAQDLAVFVVGLGGWFRRAPRDGFTMHRRKSWTAIVGAILLLIAGDTVVTHLLLSRWSVIAAWIATGLSLYGALWFIADLHALRLYPVRIERDAIHVSVGIRWRFVIPRDAIARVTLADAVPEGALKASIIEPTVVVDLTRPIEARTLFGIRRRAERVALTIDEPERFIAALDG